MPAGAKVKAWNMTEWGNSYPVDMSLAQAIQDKGFDGIHLPGGVINPDSLRTNAEAVFFVKRFFVEAAKPISSLCHGPWTLVEADVVRGRTLTSWESLATDLRNAGANWVNKSVMRDGNLVTARHPGDIPQFNPVMVDLFAGVKAPATPFMP